MAGDDDEMFRASHTSAGMSQNAIGIKIRCISLIIKVHSKKMLTAFCVH